MTLISCRIALRVYPSGLGPKRQKYKLLSNGVRMYLLSLIFWNSQRMRTKLAGRNVISNRQIWRLQEKTASYNKLSPLQGQGVTKCFGSGTLNLPDHPISPCMLILEYLLNIQSLKKVETKLITPQIIDSLKETATTFGRLGVAHCDLNYSNIFFLVGDEGISCAVIIDFGSSCTWEQEQLDEEWASVIEDQDDVLWLEQWLARMIKERP